MSATSATAAKPSRLPAMLLGAAITLVVLALHVLGVGERTELQSLDLRFRHLSTAPPTDRIVHVDIDDRSLEELGRWPWPRAQLAGIVDILSRAGASGVALDIIMPEPQPTRFVSEAAEVYSGDAGRLVGEMAPQAVFDDQALAESLERYGRVFLPMHIRLGKESSATGSSQYLQQVRKIDSAVAEVMAGGHEKSFADVLAEALPDLQAGQRGEEFDIARRAYLRDRGLLALGRFGLNPQSLHDYPAPAGQITPPLVTLADACWASGFVTVDPDADGVVRRIPLLARGAAGRAYPQFALAIAADELARSHGGACEISADAEFVSLGCEDTFTRRIPIDADGYMLINWIVPRSGDIGPQHLSAAKFGAIWQQAQALQRNDRLRRRLSLSLLEMGRALPVGLEDLYYEFANTLAPRAVELHDQLTVVQAQQQAAELFQPGASANDELAALQNQQRQVEARIDEIYAAFREALSDPAAMDLFLARPAGDDPAELAAFQQRRDEAQFLLKRLELLDAGRPEMQAQLAAQYDEARELVAGKLCLIGSVSTGAADFVPTPIANRMPGVIVHSNILNTILSGAFVTHAPAAAAIVAILGVGLIVSALAATQPVLRAGPLTAGVLAGYTAGVAGAFYWASVALPAVAPLGAGVAALLVVTAYRQLTEERAKRHIRAMFAHALSPALVDRLMEDPSLARLGGERRELTFFFSDLQGFTALSERLGEEGTVRLLNRYFDRMTEVIQNRRGGYLNKFLGDGLFVFFGAPVLQADHAARAIRAAVDCQTEVAELNRQLAEEAGGNVQLACRVGISTGEVMVGNCGSSQRMDYTAIGDPVNLASRLESANKFFGTRVLVADEAWQQGGTDGEALLARPLGQILVVGKNEPVKVWHVAGPLSEADAEVRAAYAEFPEAIALLEARRFGEAADRFRRLAEMLPGDKATHVLLNHARACQEDSETASVALRLSEK